MFTHYWPIIIILTVVAFTSVISGKLTSKAGITGWTVGFLIFAGAGCPGTAMMATFFVIGTVATSVGLGLKLKLGLAEKDKGRRKPGQVVANAGAAAICGILASMYPEKAEIFILMIAAGFAAAAGDTLSSELGNVYGRNFYNIVTFRKDQRGLNGVISIEGTIIGIAGSALIALVYMLCFGLNRHFIPIIIAGTIGNLSDSVLGATLERKGYLNNNQVNFLNTAIASLFMLFTRLP